MHGVMDGSGVEEKLLEYFISRVLVRLLAQLLSIFCCCLRERPPTKLEIEIEQQSLKLVCPPGSLYGQEHACFATFQHLRKQESE